METNDLTEPDELPPAPGRKKRPGAPRGNQNRREHGFYSLYYTREEVERILRFVGQSNLNDEVWLQRTANLRVLASLQRLDAEDVETLIKLVHLLGAGAGRVGRLARQHQQLTGPPFELGDDAFLKDLQEEIRRIAKERGWTGLMGP